MREEVDLENDIRRVWVTEEPITRRHEHTFQGVRHITGFAASGKPVYHEIHGFSKKVARLEEMTLETFRADPADDRLLFTLHWTYADAEDAAHPVSGQTAVRLSDFAIQVAAGPERRIVNKTFALNDRLDMSLASAGCKSPNDQGMAFQVGPPMPEWFSWEWFTPIGPDRLVKIQEEGELAASYQQTGDVWEISETRVVKAISLRFFPMKDAATLENASRVNIAAGAVMVWPSLIDGKVVLPPA